MGPGRTTNYIVNIATAQSLAVRSAKHSPFAFYDPENFVRSGSIIQQHIFQQFGQAKDTAMSH